MRAMWPDTMCVSRGEKKKRLSIDAIRMIVQYRYSENVEKKITEKLGIRKS